MTQTTLPVINPATDTGTDLAKYLNDWRPTLYSNHAGTARPAYAVAGQLWIDTTLLADHKLYLYDGTQDQEVASWNPATPNSIKIKADGVMLSPTAAQAIAGTNNDIELGARTGAGIGRGKLDFFAANGTGLGAPTISLDGADGSAMYEGVLNPKKGIVGRTDGTPDPLEIGGIIEFPQQQLFAYSTAPAAPVITDSVQENAKHYAGITIPKGRYLSTSWVYMGMSTSANSLPSTSGVLLSNRDTTPIGATDVVYLTNQQGAFPMAAGGYCSAVRNVVFTLTAPTKWEDTAFAVDTYNISATGVPPNTLNADMYVARTLIRIA